MNLKSFTYGTRSKNLIFQISSGFLMKGLLFFITYVQFPVFNKFLNKEEFGLWMTFIAFYNWFILFDFGIGHGLKNILTEKQSLEGSAALKKYSSSAIIGTLLIALIFSVIYESSKSYLFTGNVFTTFVNPDTLKLAVNFTFYSCMILFLHNTLSAMMYSMQKASYTNYLNLLVNIFLLGIILLANKNSFHIFSVSPLIFLSEINLIFYFLFFIFICFFFFKKHPVFIPGVSFFSYKHFVEVLKTGLKFFFIQISILFIFPIDSFVLTHFVSAASAGEYNVLIKIYGIFIVAATIINQSSWPAITEAFYKKDNVWLKKLFKKMMLINLLLIIAMVILSCYLNEVVSLWMRETYNFSKQTIVLAVSLHVFFLIATSVSTILYASNFLRSQIIIGLILIPLKTSLIYFLVVKGNLGLEGVLISSLVCFIVFASLNSLLCILKFRHL